MSRLRRRRVSSSWPYPLDDPIYDPLRQTKEYRAARERMGLVPGVVVRRD